MKNRIDYIIQGFGFLNKEKFVLSTFGFITTKVFNLAFLTSLINTVFGFNHLFLFAYAVLIVFEWITGVLASFRRKEKHESRKLGRMILKISVYSVPLYILNSFSKNTNFPLINGYELDVFLWIYWTVLIVIIWQLLVSLLENLESLQYKWAGVALRIINKKFYKQFDISNDEVIK